jgi:Phage integrase family
MRSPYLGIIRATSPADAAVLESSRGLVAPDRAVVRHQRGGLQVMQGPPHRAGAVPGDLPFDRVLGEPWPLGDQGQHGRAAPGLTACSPSRCRRRSARRSFPVRPPSIPVALVVVTEMAHSLHAAWHVLAMTGLRRGELLALRWRDIDLDAGTISVRRSVGVIKIWGQAEQIIEGTTKTSKPRVIDIDPGTVSVLRAWKSRRGSLALPLAKPEALAFGNIEGRFRHPDTFSRVFTKTVARCRWAMTRCQRSDCTTSATPTPPSCCPAGNRSVRSASASVTPPRWSR